MPELEEMRGKLSFAEIAGSRGAQVYDLSYNSVPNLVSYQYDASNWDVGYNLNVNTLTKLENAYVDDTAQAGSWTVSIPVTTLGLLTLGGIYVEWIGSGTFAVEYSTDSTTWTTVTNQSVILEDAAAYELAVDFRVTFSAGVVGGLDYLNIMVIPQRTLDYPRPATFKGLQLRSTEQRLNGQIVFPAADTTDSAFGTFEMWVKFNSLNGVIAAANSHRLSLVNGVLTRNGGASATFVNGASQTNPTLQTGIWYHIVWALSAPSVNQFFVGSTTASIDSMDMIVGYLATYNRTLVLADASALYNYNVGAAAVKISDVGNVGMTESTPATDVYSYAWSIISAGPS